MNIGVLTGGGDCAGLNAAIRAVVRRAFDKKHQVTGIKNGWLGCLENTFEPMDPNRTSGILSLGGTILGTSRTNPAKIEHGYEKVRENLKKNNVDGLIVIGGDDTLSVASELHKQGTRVIGIPKTMDNDVYGTEYCIGFDSAVTIVMDSLDKLRTTARSHHRVMVLEVMGRTAGWVALIGGLAGGADWILVPEIPSSVEEIAKQLHFRRDRGRDFSIIVVSEGASFSDVTVTGEAKKDAFGHERLDKRGIGDALSREIEKKTGFETRVTVLGHIQRGGSPTLFDRILATRLGVAGVDCLLANQSGVMVGLIGNTVGTTPLEEVIKNSPRKLDPKLYELAALFY
jgi:phosphofructokinase-like protein